MRILSIIILTCISFYSPAQIILGPQGNEIVHPAKIVVLDKSIIECIYSHKIFDPKLKETRETYDILRIGQNFSGYSNYGAFRVDSVISEIYPDGLTRNDFGRLCAQYRPSYEYVAKDLHKGIITTYDKVFIDRYYYTENIPDIRWKLENETKTICGYKCKKATANFRGREWTAWYSPELLQNNGPWKFGNLPGLILKVEDSKGEHIFEATTIRKGRSSFGPTNFDYMKTTREKYNEALAEYKRDPLAAIGDIARNPDGSPAKAAPQFFNPIELE